MMTHSPQLRAESTNNCIRIYRNNMAEPLLVQHAIANKRPYIHPVTAPDGHGVLTENAPPHHPWQHGIYTGLNKVNGIGFWEEGCNLNPLDGSFQPLPLQAARVEENRASWKVETIWLDPQGHPMLTEIQQWCLEDHGDFYWLDLQWSLQAVIDLTFGQYAYGGLFLRMPYRENSGGEAMNSEGAINGAAEGQRARWISCSMPIEGREDWAGIAYMDHPNNAEHPVPWRVDPQLGISPSRCIAGAWQLSQNNIELSRYRIFIFNGTAKSDIIENNWQAFAANQ